MSTQHRFPELMQFETKEERRDVYRKAMKKVFRRPRFWLSWIGGAIILPAAMAVFIFLFLKPIFDIPSWLRGGLVGGLVGGSFVYMLTRLFRRAIEKQIRLEMLARGLSVCMGCGYDLRGQIEPRCPECGLAFSKS